MDMKALQALNETPTPDSVFGPRNLVDRTNYLLIGGKPRDDQDKALLGRFTPEQWARRDEALLSICNDLLDELQATNEVLAGYLTPGQDD